MKIRRELIISVVALTITLIGAAQSISLGTAVERLKANRSHFEEVDKGQSLKAQATATNQDVEVHHVVFDTPIHCATCPPVTPERDPRVKKAAAESDLVAVGKVIRNISALTTSEAFVFTDSEFQLQEIWKGSVSPSNLDDGGNMNQITITAPGGITKSQGHLISAYADNLRPLKVGSTYVLFLKYLPDSHSYKEFSAMPGFDLTSATIKPLSTTMIPFAANLIPNRSEYLAAIRASVDSQKSEEAK